MGYSAFGVDHGYEEIEKLSVAGIGTKIAGTAMKGGNQLRRTAAAGMRATAGAGGAKPSMLHQAQFKAGGALKRIGGFAAKNPGAVGAGTIGAGAGAVGGGAGLFANRRRQ